MDTKNSSLIKNFKELVDHGQKSIRTEALQVIEAGIRGADPGYGTRRMVKLDGDRLYVGAKEFDLKAVRRIFVVGVGKGSFPIVEALEEILAERISEGVVVVKEGEKRRLRRIEVLEAGHPIPNEKSIAGALRIREIAEKAEEGDLVFAAVTGGASALAVLPPEGIKLHELQELTDYLLKSGAVIREMNAVRKHLCLLKGGRLVAMIQPAEAVTLTLDTAPEGMPWPDMCLADPSTFQDAVMVLKNYGIWEKTAVSIRNYLLEGLEHPERETVKTLAGMKTSIVSVGDPPSACQAAANCAAELGYRPVILGTHLEGESSEVGICLAGIVKEILKYGRPFQPPCALISGGETTVTITDACGKGGPNQELVLAFANKLGSCQRDVVCVAVDTDGTDGPTDIAGGIVDGDTMERVRRAKMDLASYIKTHNVSEALQRLNDAVITGHTGTNVMNLRVILIR